MNEWSLCIGLGFFGLSAALWLRAVLAHRVCRRAFGDATVETCERLTEGAGWHSARVAPFRMFGFGAMGLAALWLAHQYSEEDYHWFGGVGFLFFLGIVQVLIHRTPATILVLGKSGEDAIGLQQILLAKLMPYFRPIGLLETHDQRANEPERKRSPMMETTHISWARYPDQDLIVNHGTINSKVAGHCFHITSGLEWKTVVGEFMKTLPLIVMDLRHGTEHTAWELQQIIEQGYLFKTAFVVRSFQGDEVAPIFATAYQQKVKKAAAIFVSPEELGEFVRFHLRFNASERSMGDGFEISYRRWLSMARESAQRKTAEQGE